MKTIQIIAILLFSVQFGFGQQPANETSAEWKKDSSKLALLNKSLEELIKVEVDVSSTDAQDVFSTPSTVSVIDRRTIINYNFQTVAEALRTISGIDIYYTVLDQSVPTSRGILQNFYANKMLLMINGISTWQPVYGNGQIERINIHDVERIEVLKGPASVLYGSNAYTGVINIVLLNHDKHNAIKDKLNAHLKGGYPRGGEGGCNIISVGKKLIINASGNGGVETFSPYWVQSKKGSTIYPSKPNTGSDTIYSYTQQNNSYNINLNAICNNHSLYLNDYIYQHTFPGIDPSYKQGGGTMFTNEGTLINYSFDRRFKPLDTRIIFSVTYDYFKRHYPDTFTRVTSLVLEGKRYEALAKANFTVSPKVNCELGVEYEENATGSHIRINNLKDTVYRSNMKNTEHIHVISTFAQIAVKLSKFNILAGTRFTNSSVSGKNLSSRLTASYRINKTNSLKFIYGEAFRTPQMLELFFDHPTVVGNISLKPETCKSFEIAFVTGKNHFFIQALTYIAGYSNLIQRITPIPGSPSVYRNVSSFNSAGTEIELKYQSTNQLDIYCNYNHMVGLGNDAASNYNLVPKHTLRTGISKSFKNLMCSANGYLCSGVKGLLGNIDPQHFINVHIGYKNELQRGVAVIHSLSANNITNSNMLTPEYIRRTSNINALQQMGYGRSFNYSIKLLF